MSPLLRGLPRAVWAAAAFFGATMLLWTVTTPMFRGPDEMDHVGAVVYWSDNHDWPGYLKMPVPKSVAEARIVSGFHWYTDPEVILPSLTSEDAEEVRVRVPFDEVGAGSAWRLNKAAQHPPLYSMLVGSVRPMTDSLPWDTEMWVFRVISCLLLWPLPVIAAAIARRLGAGKAVVIASAFFVCAVPQLAFVGGTVNNDNLLNVAAAWLSLGLVVVLRGDLRKRTAAWVGLAAAVALFTKAWALPLVAVVAAAYIVVGVRRHARRTAVGSLAVYGGVASLGGWWWIHNLINYGSIQPSGHRVPLFKPLSLGESVGRAATRFFWDFAERFWAVLSIKDGEQAFPVWIPMVLLLAIVSLFVVAYWRSRRLGVGRTTVALMLVPAVLSVSIIVAEAVRFAMRTGTPSGIQGRYLYGSITLIGVVAILGLSTVVHRSGLLPTIVGGFAVAFTVASILRAISYHYGEARWSNPVTAFPDMLAWSPVPSAVVVAFLFAFLGCAGWALREAWMVAVRTGPGTGVTQVNARHRSRVT